MSEEQAPDSQDASADGSNHTTPDFSTHQVKRQSTVEAVSKQERKMKDCSVAPTARIDNRGLVLHSDLLGGIDLSLPTAHVGCNRCVNYRPKYYPMQIYFNRGGFNSDVST